MIFLMADSMRKLEAQFDHWSSALEGKGLKVNLDKTKILDCGIGKGVPAKAKVDACGV